MSKSHTNLEQIPDIFEQISDLKVLFDAGCYEQVFSKTHTLIPKNDVTELKAIRLLYQLNC